MKYIGAAIGDHREFGIVTVVKYVSGVRNLGEEYKSDPKQFIQDYLDRTDPKKKKDQPLNPFQEDDHDAPDNTTSVKIVKTTKTIKGKLRKITRKIYSLSDGTQHIVEIEEP